jgi:hypothetical protein
MSSEIHNSSTRTRNVFHVIDFIGGGQQVFCYIVDVEFLSKGLVGKEKVIYRSNAASFSQNIN